MTDSTLVYEHYERKELEKGDFVKLRQYKKKVKEESKTFLCNIQKCAEDEAIEKFKCRIAAVDDVNNPQKFVIKVSDEDEIDAITFIINEDENKKYIIRGEGRKEIEFTFDLEEGENRIIVTAYNKDGVTEEAKGRAVK